MSETTDSGAETENELAGLDAEEAIEHIHDEIHRALGDVTNEYDRDDAEFHAFRDLFYDAPVDATLGAHIPATSSDEEYLKLEIYLLQWATIIEQSNVRGTDTYRTYVGLAGEVLPELAPHLEKEYIEVQEEGAAVQVMRHELDKD